MQRIRKGDDVMVVTGKDKGRRGTVIRVMPNGKLFVQNVNMIKKHQRGNPQTGSQGGIIEREAAIDASNVMLYNPAAGKGDRIGYRTLDDGRKVRFFKSNNEVVDA
ncbi:50S ribosomal protein L24 [Acidihalobacter yilgarnensis]|uniref:Large ribosomal subunit protein uL24 n=1 Tax=Acidihalobacter yilgarnensis TaxID=2819280 RepID=A0A1D8IQM0_9GAMM|nr:50S ribosomal protein L24 [Acidihalobacter yilgarnensis]AOU98694.1 50S ribosomal protein L24 [Acidihalobacter yilgarnensis]